MLSNTGTSAVSNEAAISAESDYLHKQHAPTNIFGVVAAIDEAIRRGRQPLSPWSASLAKRLFDIGCVLASLPVTLPMFVIAGLAVRFTSRGPVLFRQQRMGRNGRPFTIFKFRTMPVRRNTSSRPNVTTAINQRFTPVGPFLRRWKLDELPQLLNVLLGDMSLVGPRPKLPVHQENLLHCRPGITGRATMVFAREEVTLSSIPMAQLDTYYHGVVLPLKQLLDDDYMSRATFTSDLKLIWNSVFRRWDDLQLRDLLPALPETPVRRPNMRVESPIPHAAMHAAERQIATQTD